MVTADEARQLRVSKGAVNHATYKGIFEKIAERVRRRASRGESTLEYGVPALVPGRPVYDPRHAVRYCVDKLTQRGFVVEETPPGSGTLAINWRKEIQKPPKALPKALPQQPKAPPKPATQQPKALPPAAGPRPACARAPGPRPGPMSQRLEDLRRRLNW